MNVKDPVQLNVRLDPATHRQLKLHAVMTGVPMNTLLNRAVEAILKGGDAAQQAKAA